MGWVLAKKNFFGKIIVDSLIHLPLVIPPIGIGYILLIIFGKNSFLGNFLFENFNINLSFSWIGAALACSIMSFPLMVRPIRVLMEAQDKKLDEAARTLGASELKIFLSITLPLAYPGILAGLVKSLKTGIGCKVETSLMEALLDFQFEVLTTYLNDGNRKPVRSSYNNAHAYLSAPYGIYKTKDGFIAIAMTPVPALGKLLKLKTIESYTDQKEWFTKRDEIKKLIGDWLIKEKSRFWLDILQPADIWCSEVLEWDQMMKNEGFKIIDMLQRITRSDGLDIETLRCPIRIDNQIFKSDKAAPIVGQDNESIIKEFSL